MLAVQLIELFKRIFQEANLDLFLHPYKVITTKPEVRKFPENSLKNITKLSRIN